MPPEDNLDPQIPAESEPVVVPPESPVIDPMDYKTESEKWKETAENYRKENEKYRKMPDRIKEVAPPAPVAPAEYPSEQESFIKNDYLSKREDVIHDFQAEINSLSALEWEKISPMIAPALDSSYLKAVQEGHPVARGALNSVLKGILDFAKGDKSRQADLEIARAKGIADANNLENAEISAIRPTNRNKVDGGVEITEADEAYSKDSGGVVSVKRAAEMRLAKEQRAREYASNI